VAAGGNVGCAGSMTEHGEAEWPTGTRPRTTRIVALDLG